MKKILIILLIFVSNKAVSQISYDSNCVICDTFIVRDCGYNKLVINKINNKKLRQDLLIIKRLDIFLKDNQDSIFKLNKKIVREESYFGNDKAYYFKEQFFELNYLKITLYQIFYNSKIYKGALLSGTTSSYCENNSRSYIFDKRIAKKIIEKLKSYYSFLGCGAFYLNYYPDYFKEKYFFKIPTKIEKNLINPYKISMDFFSK